MCPLKLQFDLKVVPFTLCPISEVKALTSIAARSGKGQDAVQPSEDGKVKCS
jgi:hypothetical protein